MNNETRACLKNHSYNLHAPICGIFCLHSVDVARYAALIQVKSPTNCNAHLAESIFQTRSRMKQERNRLKIMNINIKEKIENLKGKLIVSCQALPEEPLHSSFIMGRMALAAKVGGASGIRANTKEDIKEIQTQVELPIIGIVKRDYEDSEIYITPTMKEVDELMEVKPEIIAMDATSSARPEGKTLDEFFHEVKKKYPNQLFMADCSTVEEAVHADTLGFDFIGTTMVGYTKQSEGDKIEENDFEILRTIVSKVKHKVIAEGNINTPEKAKRVLELGAYSVVVGSIITRPQLITKSFVEVIGK